MSVKSSIRNFNDVKYQNGPIVVDTVNLSMQLNHISKMLEDSVMKFTKRYLIVATELEEMKREFVGQSSLINEYLTLTKKEIRFDKFDKFQQGKGMLNVPLCPNYEQKCLCVLVLDTSGSMNANGAIDELNKGLKTFKDVTMQDSTTRDRLEIAIVSFNSKVEEVQKAEILPNVQMPTLAATGQTHLVEAIEKAQSIVEERKKYYKSQGIPYYRPWIVVMTDGDPYPQGQDIDGIATRIQNDADNKKYVFFIIGIGNEVQDSTLSTLAATQWPAVRMADVKFEEFFTWLSASTTAVVTPSQDNTGSSVETPDVSPWATGFVIGTSV